jgi:fluoroquinolone resistance protein
MAVSIDHKKFGKAELTGALAKGVYDSCTFEGCDLSAADLSGCRFIDCTFTACNLSLARIEGSSFREQRFISCKMLGLRFDQCSGFGQSFHFEACILDHSSFHKAKISHSVFKNTQLKEVDFTEADMTSAVVEGCDLTGAVFNRTILEKADLRTSVNYTIDPELNRLKKARFSLAELPGLLGKYGIVVG